MNAKNDKEKEFASWVFNLDRQFSDWRRKSFENLDGYIMRENVRNCDKTFAILQQRCNAPGCNYPIREPNDAYRLSLVGDVCNLCYTMYHFVSTRAWFVGCQQQDEDLRKKNKWDDRKK